MRMSRSAAAVARHFESLEANHIIHAVKQDRTSSIVSQARGVTPIVVRRPSGTLPDRCRSSRSFGQVGIQMIRTIDSGRLRWIFIVALGDRPRISPTPALDLFF